MILVADSGSSKTDWLLALPGQEAKQFRTAGLNPYFLTEKEILKILQEQAADIIAYAADIKEIYFFGAGCSNPDRNEIVTNAISSLFPKAYVSVDSDLLGCAYATCGHEKGICCVLGTGSNLCFFDGEKIHDGQHGLGFVLGDEGSGSWFGKALITDFLYGKMPDEISEKFNEAYHQDKQAVIKNVYQMPNPNAYLAAFSKFLTTIRTSAYAQNLLRKGIVEFVETDIKSFPQYHSYKCHFVGSIAFVFADELKVICNEYGIHIGKIIRQPIHDLLTFILSREAGK
ncbi:MAG: N-acetylglucosamine kinase [Sphingobacteriales bacterium]